MADRELLTLLLVGNTGNGKSATGNSILRTQAFQTTASTSSITNEYVTASSTFKDIKINVLDGPGIDTNRSAEGFLTMSIETIKEALNLCNYRFSALLIVLKYGARFTNQESDFIKNIKGILGKNVIRDFGVCIVTHGDNFEYDYVDEHLSFKEWCQKQKGEIKSLFKECNGRCLLFNNRTKDQKLKESQVSELIDIVPRNTHYSEDYFKAADSDMQKLIIETKMPSILKEIYAFLDGQRKELKTVEAFLDFGKQFQSYTKVLDEVNRFELQLLERYHGPDNIQRPLEVLNCFKMDVDVKLKTCERNQLLQQANDRSRQDPVSQAILVLQDNESSRYHSQTQDQIEKSFESGADLNEREPQSTDVNNHDPDETWCQKIHRRISNAWSLFFKS